MIRLLAVTTLAAGMAFAQNATAGGRARPMARALRQRVLRQLNLTPEQQQQAKGILQQAKTDAEPLRQELKQNRQAMSQAIQGGADESQIRQLAATQGTILGQIVAVRSQARARWNGLLTPEQKAKAAQVRSQMRQRMQNRLEKRKQG